ncbi:hypothetical protein ATCC90586_002828 [Pythium insidiosum]|nr:hypothetical protein ATCC90586_002828 [Pythium insidiosum]
MDVCLAEAEIFLDRQGDGFLESTGGQEDFEDWDIEIITLFRMCGLDVIVTGEETLADQVTRQDQLWWKERRSKATGTLVIAIERDVIRKYRDLITANDCAELWSALHDVFAQCRPTNPVPLMGELFNRRLHPDKTDVSREHTQAQARGAKVESLSEAKNLLLARDGLDTSYGKRIDVVGGKGGAAQKQGVFAVQGCGHGGGAGRQNGNKRHQPYDKKKNRNAIVCVVKKDSPDAKTISCLDSGAENETNGVVEERLLESVYYAPGVSINIIALDYLQSAGFAVHFPTSKSVAFGEKNGIRNRFNKVERLYRVREAALMHQRYGHAGTGTLVKMQLQKARMSYNTKPTRSEIPLEKLCIDLSPIGEVAIDGSTQVLLVVDEATRFRWGFLLEKKGDAKVAITALIKRLNNKFKSREARAKKEKLGPRVNPALLVGYSPDTKCYLLLEIPTCKILKHRGENVKFVERFTLKHDYAEKMRLLLCRLPKAHDIPKTHKDALSSDYSEYWRAAEEDELSSLRAHGTWMEIRRDAVPRSHRVITSRWVYTAKADADGFVACFKAPLVIHGFRQRQGIDYEETYAPVVRYDSIGAVLYYVVQVSEVGK